MAGQQDGAKRIGSFDFVKGIAIILVALTHARIFGPLAWPLNYIIPIAVPLFFMISGYLLYRRHPNGYGIGHLAKIFWRLIAIYMVFSIVAEVMDNPSQIANPLALAYGMLVGTGGSGLYYFVPALVQMYLIFPLFARIFSNKKAVVPALVASFAISLFFDVLTRNAQVPAWNSNQPMIAFAGRYLFYFVSGMFICLLEAEFVAKAGRKMAVAVLAGAIAAYTVCFACYENQYSYIAFFISPVFAFVGLEYSYPILAGTGISRKILGIAEMLGKNSLVIYLTHGYVIYLVLLPVIGWGAGNGMVYIASAAAIAISLAVSLAFNRVFKKFLISAVPEYAPA